MRSIGSAVQRRHLAYLMDMALIQNISGKFQQTPIMRAMQAILAMQPEEPNEDVRNSDENADFTNCFRVSYSTEDPEPVATYTDCSPSPRESSGKSSKEKKEKKPKPSAASLKRFGISPGQKPTSPPVKTKQTSLLEFKRK